jgi:GTP:adenosylcobinamide-phosphate guanylyltransferase
MSLALILAAGSGERLGAQMPKALVQLGGRSLLQWSIDAISAVAGVQEIVLALPAGVPAPHGLQSVTGGAVRSESVRRALSASPHAGPVLVHDAARPLVTPALAERVLDALHADADADGAIAAVPVSDTVKRAREGTAEVAETLARSALFPDSRESLRSEAGEYLLAVREGLVPGEDHVRAELGEVLAGIRPGRTSDHELTLFRSLGLAIEDLAAAELAVANACRQGIGAEVEL